MKVVLQRASLREDEEDSEEEAEVRILPQIKLFLCQRYFSIKGAFLSQVYTLQLAQLIAVAVLLCAVWVKFWNTIFAVFSVIEYQFLSICKQSCEIFKCRLFVLLTIKQSLTKLQKQIKKILVIMSMSPPPSKPSTLEKKQVKLWNSSHTVDIILNKGQPTGQLDRILVILSI